MTAQLQHDRLAASQSSDCYAGAAAIHMAAAVSVLDLTVFALRRFSWQLLRVCSVSRRPFCSSS